LKPKLTAIVPLGPKENLRDVERLLSSFKSLEVISEVIISGVKGCQALQGLKEYKNGQFEVVLVETSLPGRAKQLNFAMDKVSNDWVWILHVDSDIQQVKASDFLTVVGGAPTNRMSLFHFQLSFKEDGPPLTFLNAQLANLRSRYLKLPFGDQGFFFHRDVYREIGPFDERASFGEDHLFVWEAHKKAVPVKELSATISTSARKYKMKGWGKTTRAHVYLSFKQGTPEFFSMVRARAKKFIQENKQ